MLKSMRKNIKSLAPTLWFVIAAFIISIFAVWGGAGRLGEGGGTDTVVKVGKNKINADIYIQNLRQRLEIMKQQFSELNAAFIQQLNIPQQVLEQIIQQSVLAQAADKMGIRASSEEIRERVKNLPVFQRDGQFVGFDEYQQILSYNRISPSIFEQSLVEDIKINKLIQVLTAGISVTREELWEAYKKNNESAKIEYVLIDFEKTELPDEPSPERIHEFFTQKQAEYKIPEKRIADYYFINTEEIKERIELEESEIQKYYTNNQAQFQEPEKTQIGRIFLPYNDKQAEQVMAEAEAIHERIDKGEDFGQLAKTFSKDEKAESNGDWGLYDWRRLPQQEQERIQDLAQSEISDPVQTDEGVSLLRIIQKDPARQKSLQEVRTQIVELLEDQTARARADSQIAELEKAARKEKSIDVAAQKLGYQISSTGPLAEGDSLGDIDPSGTISRALFTLETEQISSPLFTFNGVGIAQLKQTDSGRQAEYEEVEETVRQDYLLQQKKTLALEKARSLQARLNASNFEQIAEEMDLEFKAMEEHKREQYLGTIGDNSEIDRLAFSLALNETSEPVEYQAGYVLMHVLDRKEVTEEDFAKNKDEEKQTLLEAKKNRYFQSYYVKLRDEIGVKADYNLFFRINSDIMSHYQQQ
jgi:peptidyl-prolyl cis-trans isomerase D